MAFTLPTMNLSVNIWRDPALILPLPPITAPDVVTIGNLTPGRRGLAPTLELGNEMYLLMPAATVIYDGSPGPAWGMDLVEVPAGSGRLYRCYYADNIASGFPNEHVLAVIQKVMAFGSGAGSTPPPPPPPPSPSLLGVWTSSGVNLGTKSIVWTQTQAQDVVLFVASYNYTFGATVAGFTALTGGVPAWTGPPNCLIQGFKGHWPAGTNSTNITYNFGASSAAIQAFAWGLPLTTATQDRYKTGFGSASSGSIVDTAAGAFANETYLGVYATMGGTSNAITTAGWTTPSGPPIVDTVLAMTMRFTIANKFVAVPAIQSIANAVGPYTNWAGMLASFK